MKKPVVIIGGGIVGLATALQLQKSYKEVPIIIIEKEGVVAKHQTGNNSGVIHSGIYYKPGSLKAINCKRGYQLLLEFCDTHQIPYDLCGKVIVATSEKELPRLQNIYERGVANGLQNLQFLNQVELAEKEPHAKGIKAVFVPQAGIVDYGVVARKMAELFVQNGGTILFNTSVKALKQNKGFIEILTNKETIQACIGVNCAGLYCDKIYEMDGPKNIPIRIIPFRGEYYTVKASKRHLVKNLIYPVPDPSFPFLGVHFTRRIDGEIEAGPNAVLAYRREGYTKKAIYLPEFLESISWPGFIKVAFKYWKTGIGEIYRSYNKAAFTKALQKLLPDIQSSDLEQGGAGVRAQACLIDGSLPDDFIIEESSYMIHVLNAPSPAATSSLSIGITVSEKIVKKLS
jgi:L-2-hydroxyglutarate oxidase